MIVLKVALKEETAGETVEIASWKVPPLVVGTPVKLKFHESRRYIELIAEDSNDTLSGN